MTSNKPHLAKTMHLRTNRVAVLSALIVTALHSRVPAEQESPLSPAPFAGKQFQGRIAYSADGNHNDPDDWAASPVALAIVAECGWKDRLVHFDYNCILPKTDPAWEKTHAESVLGAAERYGFDPSRFFDCQKQLEAALDSIARAIDASSAEDPLYFIVAGPMEVPYRGIERSKPEKRRFVTCISHSRWNDGFASAYTFTHTKRSVIGQDVHWVQIRDQNALLSKSPYGKPAPAESFQPYHWMRDARDAKVRFLWDRLQISTRPDPSDAGMAYFLMTGDEAADPDKLRRLLAEHVVPPPVAARQQVRLEAENFRHLEGFALEDRNDRNVSHRLAVRLANDKGRIKTIYLEPFAPASAKYDVQVRYFDEQGQAGRFTLLVNGVSQTSWQAPAKGTGWMTDTVEKILIKQDDEIAIEAQGSARLDYVQLNLRN